MYQGLIEPFPCRISTSVIIKQYWSTNRLEILEPSNGNERIGGKLFSGRTFGHVIFYISIIQKCLEANSGSSSQIDQKKTKKQTNKPTKKKQNLQTAEVVCKGKIRNQLPVFEFIPKLELGEIIRPQCNRHVDKIMKCIYKQRRCVPRKIQSCGENRVTGADGVTRYIIWMCQHQTKKNVSKQNVYHPFIWKVPEETRTLIRIRNL